MRYKATRTFDGSKNKLTNFNGGPEEVGSCLYLEDNKITDIILPRFKLLPEYIEYGVTIWLQRNKLTTMPDFPDADYQYIRLEENELTSLIGLPDKVGGSGLHIHNNEIQSLEGLPKVILGDLTIDRDITKYVDKDIEKICKVGKINFR